MKLLLVSNVLEHAGFSEYLRAAAAAHPDAEVLCAGDLLNIFPEPGEDFAGSMFHEIFGSRVVDEMRRLVETGFSAADDSWLVEPLRDMFLPGGQSTRRALALADARYTRVFADIAGSLSGRSFYYIDGNMDYPGLSRSRAAAFPDLVPISDAIVDIGGVKVAGMGGIPNTAHPFRGVVEISPNEMSEAEYERRLESLVGAEILCTHLSPEEAPALARFLEQGHARILVCRAPFNFRHNRDFRGRNGIRRFGDAWVISVRPFEWPAGSSLVIDVEPGGAPSVEVFSYAAAARPAA
ncbi:MAG: hypothetical protein QM820_42360 [Minicystis sp.]